MEQLTSASSKSTTMAKREIVCLKTNSLKNTLMEPHGTEWKLANLPHWFSSLQAELEWLVEYPESRLKLTLPCHVRIWWPAPLDCGTSLQIKRRAVVALLQGIKIRYSMMTLDGIKEISSMPERYCFLIPSPNVDNGTFGSLRIWTHPLWSL